MSRLCTTPPGRHVALFDGRCGLCRASAARLQAVGRPGAVEYRDLHEDGALDALPGLTREACLEALQLVLPDGRVVSGAEAVARIVRTRRGLGVLARLYFVPGLRWLLDRAYAAIARRRYRISAAEGVCQEGFRRAS